MSEAPDQTRLPRWGGDGELPAALNLLADAIENPRPPRLVAGRGMRVSYSDSGIIITSLAAEPSADTANPDHPFKIIRAGADKVRIVYGSVNGVGATTGDDANDGTVSPVPTITLSEGLNNIYVEAVWDGAAEPMAFQSCAVRVGETPSRSDTLCAFGIGAVFIDSETGAMTINQGVTSSLACARYKCADGAMATYYWEGV